VWGALFSPVEPDSDAALWNFWAAEGNGRRQYLANPRHDKLRRLDSVPKGVIALLERLFYRLQAGLECALFNEAGIGDTLLSQQAFGTV
jgi:hypothetical protein